MIEIERKFLVKNTSFLPVAKKSYTITQGYLSTNPERAVRIRTKNNIGYITIKGKSTHNNTTRFEWEKEIPLSEAKQLLTLCKPEIIEKERYIIPYDNFIFEVDVFLGKNKGLLLAEIELETATTLFKKPKWLGKEVTNDTRYFNLFLSKKPYTQW